jgi:hypothetical protein
MSERRFRHIPVVEGDSWSIISIRDLMGAALQMFSADAHVGSDFPEAPPTGARLQLHPRRMATSAPTVRATAPPSATVCRGSAKSRLGRRCHGRACALTRMSL